jgi:hypothetical protein
MNIEDLTIKQARELAALFSVGQVPTKTEHPLVGKNCIVRTVTMIYTGRMVEANATEFVLVDCSWIPETDRYMQFVADGKVKECEPFPDGLPVYINRGALMECCELVKPLPRSQK